MILGDRMTAIKMTADGCPDPALQKVKPHRARDGYEIITIKNRYQFAVMTKVSNRHRSKLSQLLRRSGN